MIDLNALDNDPWPTIPVKKDDLRALAAALQKMERDLHRITQDAGRFYNVLVDISKQGTEPHSQKMAKWAIDAMWEIK
jgi:hypothetical protein